MLNNNANVQYTEVQEYSDILREKDWLTSSEALEYIKRECPRSCWGITGHSQKYVGLYRAVRDGQIVSCKTFTSGGTAVRFYSKESIDHRERYYSMEPKEYAVYKCKRDLSFARDRIKEDRGLVKELKLELARVKTLDENDKDLVDWEYEYNKH
tara:strand:+ start:3345 stop:3806 length:462 start_codon:yes stop_codon:yes gene_type:complete